MEQHEEVEKFEKFLDESINTILNQKPKNPYDELIYVLYRSMGENLQKKNPNLYKFCEEFQSELN